MVDAIVEMFSETTEPTELATTGSPENEPRALLSEKRPSSFQRQTRLPLDFLGTSRKTQDVRSRIQQFAEISAPVAIQGEPGSGKTFAARMIHSIGKRASRPFLALDCRTLSSVLFQQLLFGENYTTSSNESPGIGIGGHLQQADGGTLLLTHFESLAFPLQKTIEQQFCNHNLNTSATTARRTPDVRLIVTTEKELSESVHQKSFPRELCRQLISQSMTISPLRERIEDLGLLTECFLNRLAIQDGLSSKRLTLDALKLLEEHYWPGNLRELQNVIERACCLDAGPKLTSEMLRPWIAEIWTEEREDALGMSLRGMERKLIETTFTRCNGNRERTAKILDIGIRTLSGKLREYGYPPRGGPGSNKQTHSQKAA